MLSSFSGAEMAIPVGREKPLNVSWEEVGIHSFTSSKAPYASMRIPKSVPAKSLVQTWKAVSSFQAQHGK